MKTELLALIDDLVKFELYVTKGQLSAAKDAKRIRADIVFLLDKAEQAQAPAAQAPAAVEPVSGVFWRERWFGSGGKEGYEGWSIVGDRELIAYLGREISSEAVSAIVMAHNTTSAAPTTKAEPAPTGTPQIRWVADGKVYGNPTQHDLREALVVAQHCACDACKAEPADALDAARWRYAMDWDNKEFAVCKRQDMSWAPIKTSGPLDHAMVPQKD